MDIIVPTFIIAGAGKSGTTYLAHILGLHPEVCMAVPKEPRFFSLYEGLSPPSTYARGLGFYRKFFAGYKGQKHVGDASPVYMYDPDSPRLIKRHIPDVKLIFIFRNPIERVYSSYWEDLKHGARRHDFATLLFSQNERIREYIDNSRYDVHLQRYFDLFSREQMLILLYDDLKRDSAATIEEILSFLDLGPLPDEVDLEVVVNPSSLPRSRILFKALHLHRLSHNVRAVLPSGLIPPLQRAAKSVRSRLQRPFRYPEMDDRCRSHLAKELEGTIASLSALLGRDLSHWYG